MEGKEPVRAVPDRAPPTPRWTAAHANVARTTNFLLIAAIEKENGRRRDDSSKAAYPAKRSRG